MLVRDLHASVQSEVAGRKPREEPVLLLFVPVDSLLFFFFFFLGGGESFRLLKPSADQTKLIHIWKDPLFAPKQMWTQLIPGTFPATPSHTDL